MDKYLALAAFSLLIFESYALVKDLNPRSSLSFSAIANLEEVRSEVLVRPAKSDLWVPARPDEQISEGMSVLTRDNSNCLISMLSGAKIQVAESSLVTLKKDAGQGAGSGVDLKHGQVTLNLADDEKVTTDGLVFKAGHAGTSITLVKTPAATGAPGPSVIVKVNSGSVKVDAAKNETSNPRAEPAAQPEYSQGDLLDVEKVTAPAQNSAAQVKVLKLDQNSVRLLASNDNQPVAPPTDEKYRIHIAVADSASSATGMAIVTTDASRTPPPESAVAPTPASSGDVQIQGDARPPLPATAESKTAGAPRPAPPPPPPPQAPVEPLAPAPQQSQAQYTGFRRYSVLTVAPVFSISSLTATDSTTGGQATLGSGLNSGLELGWRQFWSTSWQTAVTVKGDLVNYGTTSTLRSLDGTTHFFGTLGLEGTKGQEGFFQYLLNIGLTQLPFIRGESSTANIIDSVSVPFAGVQLNLPLHHDDQYLLKAGVKADYLAPTQTASYSVQSGYAVTADLNLRQKSTNPLDHKSLSGDVYLRCDNQNTTLTSQQTIEIGVSLTYSFDFFQAAGVGK